MGNPKEHVFEVNDVDSFDIQGLEKPALDIEYLDDFTVEVNEEIVALRALNRNVELCEAEHIDDMFIKGEPRQYNDEYIEETEVVEETTTTNNLRNRNTYNETNTTTTKKGSSNLDNMSRKVIVETSKETTTNKYNRNNLDNMGRKVIVETSKTTTGSKYNTNKNLDNMGRKVIVATSTKKSDAVDSSSRRGGLDNMGRKVIVETSTKTTTTTGKYGSSNRNLDNMGRKVIIETSTKKSDAYDSSSSLRKGGLDNMGRKVIIETTKTTTTTGKYGSGSGSSSKGNLDNMGRKVIIETSTKKSDATSSGYGGYGVSSSGLGISSRKVVVEQTKGGRFGGEGTKKTTYSIESVGLTKSGNEKDWKTGSGSITLKGKSKAGYGKKAWDIDVTNGDEVFTGRHPSDEEVSTGGNGYSKFSTHKEVRYQTTSKGGAPSKASKYSFKITKGN